MEDRRLVELRQRADRADPAQPADRRAGPPARRRDDVHPGRTGQPRIQQPVLRRRRLVGAGLDRGVRPDRRGEVPRDGARAVRRDGGRLGRGVRRRCVVDPPQDLQERDPERAVPAHRGPPASARGRRRLPRLGAARVAVVLRQRHDRPVRPGQRRAHRRVREQRRNHLDLQPGRDHRRPRRAVRDHRRRRLPRPGRDHRGRGAAPPDRPARHPHRARRAGDRS